MKIIVIGAVAAGTSAAAKARRNAPDVRITIYEKGEHISYSGCAMPYYLSGEVKNAEYLTPRDSAYFKSHYNVDVHILHEVLKISPNEKSVTVKNLVTQKIFTDAYDKLVIATGARAVAPPIPGMDNEHAFVLRTISDMNKIDAFIKNHNPKRAAIIGSGFVGLEMCESLKHIGMDVTLLERLPQVTPGLDEDMAVHVLKHLEDKGVDVLTGVNIVEITANGMRLEGGKEISADMIIVATGVRPNSELAQAAGITLGVNNSIRVNKKMQTNYKDIYSCGDCAEQFHIVTQMPVYRPLGSTANKTGRIAGDSMTGGSLEFRGILGTGIFRVFDMAVAQTGLSQREAEELGYDVAVSQSEHISKPEYMNGRDMIIKCIADRRDGRILGAQIVGYDGVDKRIDVFVTAITYNAKVEDLFHLDLAYAPPFSTTRDPVMYTGMILESIVKKSSSKK